MRGTVRTAVAVLIAAALLAPAGCRSAEEMPALEPVLAPPVIGEAGTLRVGVDLEYPPFAGVDDGREAGLDIDIAAGIAAHLGLVLETVQVEPSEATTALADGSVDMVMSVPLDEQSLLGATLAGTYVSNGPAYFVYSAEPSGTADTSGSDIATGGGEPSSPVEFLGFADLRGKRIGAQDASVAFWLVEYELGEGAVAAYPTLRAAIEALHAGEVDVVVCDAVVGAYIGRDYPGVVYAGPVAEPTPLGVAVSPDNGELESAVRDALNALAAEGVLGTILSTWANGLPAAEIGSSGSAEESATP